MTSPNLTPPNAQPAQPVKSMWGAKPVFKPITPEQQAQLDAEAKARAEVQKLKNAAQNDQQTADKVVAWALQIWKKDAWQWRNGGDAYKEVVTSDAWAFVAAKWAATQVPGYVCSVRNPKVKKQAGNLNIGKLVGNIELHTVDTGARAMDLHVHVVP